MNLAANPAGCPAGPKGQGMFLSERGLVVADGFGQVNLAINRPMALSSNLPFQNNLPGLIFYRFWCAIFLCVQTSRDRRSGRVMGWALS
jgi:hypothetical protein